MTNSSRIASNTIVQVISRILTAGISLVAIGYLARYLGVEAYGQYNFIFAYLGLFGVAIDFGFFLLQVRAVVNNPGREGFVLGNFLSLKLLLSAIVFPIAFITAALTFKDPLLVTGVMIGAISQIAVSFLHIPHRLFQARLEMQIVAISNVISRLVYGAAIVWAVFADLGLLNVILAVSVVNAIHLIALSFLSYRIAKVRPHWDRDYIKSVIKEAIPIGLTTVLAMIYFRIDAVMLGYMQGHHAVGIYTTPYKILDVFLTIPVIFMSSVFPVMTQAIEQGREHLQRIFTKAFNYSGMIAGPLLAGGFVLATPIINLLAGKGYEDSVLVLQILISVTTLAFFGAVFTYTVIANGKQQMLIRPYLAATIFNIGINYLLIPHYSYIGAAYATVATELAVVLFTGYVVYRKIGLALNLRSVGIAALATIAMGAAMWPLRQYNFILVGLFGCLVYAGVLVGLGGLSLTTIRQILKR